MRGIHDELLLLGAEVLVVSFMSSDAIAAYTSRLPLPFPAVADRTRDAYRAFGLHRTTLGGILRPGVLWGYFRFILRGWMPWKKLPEADTLQLGGDFILDREGRLAWARPSADPTDRPTSRQILDAVRAVSTPGGAFDP